MAGGGGGGARNRVKHKIPEGTCRGVVCREGRGPRGPARKGGQETRGHDRAEESNPGEVRETVEGAASTGPSSTAALRGGHA